MTSHARSRLLTAAAELLASRGYDALSESAIVESAGLPSDSFDGHFVDIDDLCLVVLGEIGRARVRAVVGGVRGSAVAVPSPAMGGHLPFLGDAHDMEQLEAELRRLAPVTRRRATASRSSKRESPPRTADEPLGSCALDGARSRSRGAAAAEAREPAARRGKAQFSPQRRLHPTESIQPALPPLTNSVVRRRLLTPAWFYPGRGG
ncbi:MAG: TetR family transcriptional regulator [Microthrixaceae bacterium]|nr:TetR family transcriptional regulator [Microthrixaceae bacterium]